LSNPLFPDWKNLLTKLVDELENRGKLSFSKNELTEKLNKGEGYLDIAGFCADQLGKSEYREIIEETFDKEIEYEKIPNAYKRLLSLPCKSFITTNYDRIPEVGSQGKFNTYNNLNISEAVKAIEKGKKIILKVHGDITLHDSIILTREDYKRIIFNNSSVSTALKSLFSTSTVCFIGFSLNDPHFEHIQVGTSLRISYIKIVVRSCYDRKKTWSKDYFL